MNDLLTEYSDNHPTEMTPWLRERRYVAVSAAGCRKLREDFEFGLAVAPGASHEVRSKVLYCRCGEGQPCHGDVIVKAYTEAMSAMSEEEHRGGTLPRLEGLCLCEEEVSAMQVQHLLAGGRSTFFPFRCRQSHQSRDGTVHDQCSRRPSQPRADPVPWCFQWITPRLLSSSTLTSLFFENLSDALTSSRIAQRRLEDADVTVLFFSHRRRDGPFHDPPQNDEDAHMNTPAKDAVTSAPARFHDVRRCLP